MPVVLLVPPCDLFGPSGLDDTPAPRHCVGSIGGAPWVRRWLLAVGTRAVDASTETWSAALQMLFNPWTHRQAPTFWDTLSATLVFHGLICVFAYALILAIT